MKVNKKLMRMYRENPDLIRDIFKIAENQSILSGRDEVKDIILNSNPRAHIKNLAVLGFAPFLISTAYAFSGLNSFQGEMKVLLPSAVGSAIGYACMYWYGSNIKRICEDYNSARESALENLTAKKNLEAQL